MCITAARYTGVHWSKNPGTRNASNKNRPPPSLCNASKQNTPPQRQRKNAPVPRQQKHTTTTANSTLTLGLSPLAAPHWPLLALGLRFRNLVFAALDHAWLSFNLMPHHISASTSGSARKSASASMLLLDIINHVKGKLL